ncbi:ESX-1 secretion-associated protein EspK-like [Maniola jurtina]|uniref:ESX-1 secretion-associated protein EspK-like n=1 Tax=Maniola jurtina TaxID=191418 RepID=UPI001E68A263|nr:ESX-1 secretion-associated protein EspK-like [Maniola jurtina]
MISENYAGAGPSRAGPEKNCVNLDGAAGQHDADASAPTDAGGPGDARSPRALAHNISINVTDADSPPGVRRRIHLRSLSDVTPAARSPVARARSHSERPRASPAPSPAASPAPSPRRPPAGLTPAPLPRAVRSERSSPDASLHALADEARGRPELDPWRKMSELDLGRAGRQARAALDPWVRKPARRAASRDSVGDGARVRRGRLERAGGVCDACGGAPCECWRSACTCSPRASPARLQPRGPPRAHSHDEGRPRRLYKSSSQRALAVPRAPDAPDPLLETTC